MSKYGTSLREFTTIIILAGVYLFVVTYIAVFFADWVRVVL